MFTITKNNRKSLEGSFGGKPHALTCCTVNAKESNNTTTKQNKKVESETSRNAPR